MTQVTRITRLTSIPESWARARSSDIARMTRPVGLRARNSPIAAMATVAATIVAVCASDRRTSPIT